MFVKGFSGISNSGEDSTYSLNAVDESVLFLNLFSSWKLSHQFFERLSLSSLGYSEESEEGYKDDQEFVHLFN